MNEPLETIEVFFDNGESKIFTIYFTYEKDKETYVVYYDPETPDDVYVKRYNETNHLIELTPEELAYAEEIIGQYEEEEGLE
jgi:hypothetical protein